MSWERSDGREDYERYGNDGYNDRYSHNEERQSDYDRGFRQAREEDEGRRYRNQQEDDYWDNYYTEEEENETSQMEDDYWESFQFEIPPQDLFNQ